MHVTFAGADAPAFASTTRGCRGKGRARRRGDTRSIKTLMSTPISAISTAVQPPSRHRGFASAGHARPGMAPASSAMRWSSIARSSVRCPPVGRSCIRQQEAVMLDDRPSSALQGPPFVALEASLRQLGELARRTSSVRGRVCFDHRPQDGPARDAEHVGRDTASLMLAVSSSFCSRLRSAACASTSLRR